MKPEQIVDYTALLLALTGIFLVLCKISGVRALRRQEIPVRSKTFGFYSEQEIFTTASKRKKKFMEKANVLTPLIYACFLPAIAMLMIKLISWTADIIIQHV